MYRKITGGTVPSDYVFFWNRPFGRGTCIFLSAIALAALLLPTSLVPAQSEPSDALNSPAAQNTPEGASRSSFRNAIWGNRGGKTSSASFLGNDDKDPQKKLDMFIRYRLQIGETGWINVVAKMKGKLNKHRTKILMDMGALTEKPLDVIEGVAFKAPLNVLSRVAELPWVERISEDFTVEKMDVFTFNNSLANVAYAQYGLTGRGVTVAVLDSGISWKPDIHNRVLANVSFVPNDPATEDLSGHGTHVAGIIAGNGKASSGKSSFQTFYGIAREAGLVNVRVLDKEGKGNVSTIIQGIEWVIANKDQYGIRIINLSLGHPVGESYTTDPLCLAVKRAWESGILVVCAAGNSGRKNAQVTPGEDNEGYGLAYGSIESPGNSPYALTVGATKSSGKRENDVVATYSSRGPSRLDFVLKPDLVAPGNRVISLRNPNSTVDVLYGSSNAVASSEYRSSGTDIEGPQYFRLSGTSMAAPVVAGAAALMLQKDPSLTPDTVKARLMISADVIANKNGVYDVCSYGAGYLNVAAALNLDVLATKPATSPTLSRAASGDVMIDANNVIWGSNVIWGLTSPVTGSNIIWGTNVIWGEYLAPTTDNIIWGSNVIWGTAVWLDNVIWGSNTPYDVKMNSITGEEW